MRMSEEERLREEKRLAREEAKRVARREAILNRDADRLEASLVEVPPPADRASLVVLVGLPGSGKSTFARELAKRHPSAILDSDALRQELFAVPEHSKKEHSRLFPALHHLMGRLLSRGVTVIVDATNLKESSRKPYYEIAKEHDAPIILVRVEAPIGVIRDRLRKREAERDPLDRSTATLEVFEKMVADEQSIQHEHLTVDTSEDMTPVLDKITSLLQS